MTSAKQINRIIEEESEVHFERLSTLRVIWTSLLARQHVFLLGPPGTDKTRMLDSVCQSIDGAEFFEILANNQLGLEDFFGPIDMVRFSKDNIWEASIDGYLPTAHVALIDEVFKANGAILNPLLDVLVRFRYKHGARPIQLPLLMAAMAANEMPQDDSLGAFWDRRGPALLLDYIREESNVDKLLRLASGDLPQLDPTSRTTIPLADVQHAVLHEVPAIILPAEMREAVRNLKNSCEHPADGPKIIVSDRRWFQAVRLLQASAYLEGREQVDDDDLDILQHFLWETPEMIPAVRKRVLQLSSPQVAEARELAELLDEWSTTVTSLKDQSGTAKGQAGAEINGKMTKTLARLNQLKADAAAANRSVTGIDEVIAQAHSVRDSVYLELLNVPEEVLKKMNA